MICHNATDMVWCMYQKTKMQAKNLWMQGRVPDPPLSPKGERESELLAQHFGPRLNQGGGAVLMCSPMLRALQTIWPLAREAGLTCTVMPELYEVGGIYDDTGASPPALTAHDIRNRFPKFLTHHLPQVQHTTCLRVCVGVCVCARARACMFHANEERKMIVCIYVYMCAYACELKDTYT
jgi:hypothetical protein